jgi:hypothetical protein
MFFTREALTSLSSRQYRAIVTAGMARLFWRLLWKSDRNISTRFALFGASRTSAADEAFTFHPLFGLLPPLGGSAVSWKQGHI